MENALHKTLVLQSFSGCPFAYHLQFSRVDPYVHLRFRSQVLPCGGLEPLWVSVEGFGIFSASTRFRDSAKSRSSSSSGLFECLLMSSPFQQIQELPAGEHCLHEHGDRSKEIGLGGRVVTADQSFPVVAYIIRASQLEKLNV